MALKFNGDVLYSELRNIEKEKEKLKDIKDELNNQLEFLKDYWQSKTSTEMYSSFAEFCDYYEEVITTFENDIKYLDQTISNYGDFESATNKTIDEKIAV